MTRGLYQDIWYSRLSPLMTILSLSPGKMEYFGFVSMMPSPRGNSGSTKDAVFMSFLISIWVRQSTRGFITSRLDNTEKSCKICKRIQSSLSINAKVHNHQILTVFCDTTNTTWRFVLSWSIMIISIYINNIYQQAFGDITDIIHLVILILFQVPFPKVSFFQIISQILTVTPSTLFTPWQIFWKTSFQNF